MTSSDSKVTKIQTHFKALSEASPSLNTASDELTKSVAILDESLKKLNIGLTVWVSFRFRGPFQGSDPYDEDQIGYCKVNGTWGIALRHIWGEEPDWFNEEGPWLFHDASREMRLYSVDKIPDVIEALAKEALSTTKQIQEKTKQVLELASVVKEIADAPKVIAPGYQSPRTMKDLAALAKGVQESMKSMKDLADLTKGQQGS